MPQTNGHLQTQQTLHYGELTLFGAFGLQRRDYPDAPAHGRRPPDRGCQHGHPPVRAIWCIRWNAWFLCGSFLAGSSGPSHGIVQRFCGVWSLPRSDGKDIGAVISDHSMVMLTLPETTIPVLCLIGGKWTTFRGFSEQAANQVLCHLGLPARFQRQVCQLAAVWKCHSRRKNETL